MDSVDVLFVFFFNDTATTEIYTLSLHDALPIWSGRPRTPGCPCPAGPASTSGRAASRSRRCRGPATPSRGSSRSEEHTSELQSRQYLVCRLLLEKKKKQSSITSHSAFIILLTHV